MSNPAGQRLIPIFCVAIGATCALLIGNAMRQTEIAPDLTVKQEFDRLPSGEQALILGRAESLHRRWEADPEEYRRLKELHEAVTEDAQLQDKLERFHRWWLTLDSQQKSRLKADGQFAVNWPQLTENLYRETLDQPREIKVRFVDIAFSEADYERFLNDVIPAPVPDELVATLSTLTDKDQRCERVLAQSIWLFENIAKPDFKQPSAPERPEPAVSLEAMREAVEKHLVTEEYSDRYRGFMDQLTHGQTGNMDPRNIVRAHWFMLALPAAGVHHFDKIFRDKQPANNPKELVSLFVALDDDEQTELLKQDPAYVQKALSRSLIREDRAKLGEGMNRIAREFPFLFRRGRGRGTPGGGPGSGFRGRDGRGPGNEEDRDPDRRRPDGGRGPDRDGGRGGKTGR